MFGLSWWERAARKLEKSPLYTEDVITEIHKESPEQVRERIQQMAAVFGGEDKVPESQKHATTVVDIVYTTASGVTSQLHYGGAKGEALSEFAVGEKVTVAYVEHKGNVIGKLKE